MGAELFHEDGLTDGKDGQTDVKKLIATVYNF
jgi:hypothetical protein